MSRQISEPTDEELAAIASTAILQRDGSFRVLSSDGSKSYTVRPTSCSCRDWVERGGSYDGHCKHQLSVALLCPLPMPAPKPYLGDPFANF